jgi:L-asparaginase
MSSTKNTVLSQKIVILGTGGTIAGLSLNPGQGGAYNAAQVGIADLLAQSLSSLPSSRDDGQSASTHSGSRVDYVTEQIAQVDSKDMDETIWRGLLQRIDELQQDPSVLGMVVTHGTDTIEETGFLLHACWPHGKPVVLTCAMKPADAPDADGPGNLRQAVLLAQTPGCKGIHLVCGGAVFEGHAFQKLRTDGVQPFQSQLDAGADAPYPVLSPQELLSVLKATTWPRVDIVMNHAGADGALVHALLDAVESQTSPGVGARALAGIVLAGTGQGTCSARLHEALRRAKSMGVLVYRSTRALLGKAAPRADEEFVSVPWTPVKARVAMMLDGLSGRAGIRKPAP